MRILIFLETIISLDIVWNLIYKMEKDDIIVVVIGIAFHYINFIIKCLLFHQEIQKWQWWIGIIIIESISQGLMSLVWRNELLLIEVLVILQCAWIYDPKLFYPGVTLMLYFTTLEYFKKFNSFVDILTTSVMLFLFLLFAYKTRPQIQDKKDIIANIRLEDISIKGASDRHSVLEEIPWLSEQRFMVFNESLLVVHQQAQLTSLLETQGEEQISDSVLLNQFFECKCESLSSSLLKILLSIQPSSKVLFKYNVKQICLSILQSGDSIRQFYSAAEMDSKYFKLQNFKLNFIVLTQYQEKLLVVHLEQQLERKPQYTKSAHTPSIIQNISSNSQSKGTESNHTITSQILSNMFQSVSHEFGTYLNCIISVSQEALKHTEISEDIKDDYFEPIQINSQLLFYILRNIRDYNTILLNQFVLRLQEFNPKEKILEIIKLMKRQLECRQNRIEILCQDDLNIYNDSERYKQVIYQLLSNSIRFTFNGLITIEVQVINREKIQTIVTDTGIGMNSMEILKLNEMLNDHRKLIKISKNSVGCGLGLTISNVIVKKMSGKGISFESSQNKETKGSRFTFITRSSQQLYNDSQYQPSQSYVKILNQTYYVECSPSESSIKQMGLCQSKQDQFQLLQSQINSRNLQGKLFSTTNSELKSGETNQQFMHGVTEFNKLQTLNMKIDENQIQEVEEEVQEENICDTSYNYKSLMNVPNSLNANLKTQILQYNIKSNCCQRVLLVDDEIFNISTLQLILSKYQIKTEKALNGVEALKRCEERKYSPCKQCLCAGFVVIFLDLNMPIMDGFETVRALKQQMASGIIPKALCIANTGYADLETKQNALTAGMDFYLTKPFEIKILEEYLKAKFPLGL